MVLAGVAIAAPLTNSSSWATTTSTTYTPVADAYVNQAYPSTNYGTNSALRTDASPSTVRSYLRVDVTGLAGTITKAQLRLYANSSNSTGITVAAVADTSWSETAMTWSNAPAVGTAGGSSAGITSGSWSTIDVTTLVKATGLLSLALTTTSSTQTSFGSRESGTLAPQLVVDADVPATTTTTVPPAPSGPCGTRPTAPATYDHVMWIWMENHTYTSVIGTSAAPYQTQLAQQCGSATSYSTVGSPSLPNYIGATAGSTLGIADDGGPSSHVITNDNLFRQVRARGKTEKSYQESMTANCALSSSGTYAVKHNPAAYYSGGGDRTACTVDDVAMGSTASGNFLNDLTDNTLPTFSFVTPNLCNDTHDCSVATGDTWLKAWMPKILASPAYQSGATAIFLVYDEYTSIPNVIISPSTPVGARLTGTVNHYALLRTTEEMLGITSFLSGAATAPSMRTAFTI